MGQLFVASKDEMMYYADHSFNRASAKYKKVQKRAENLQRILNLLWKLLAYIRKQSWGFFCDASNRKT